MNVTATQTPQQLANASSSITGGFADTTGLTPVLLFIVYALGALVAAQFALPWVARSRFITGAAQRVVLSIHYAIKGIAATVVLGLIAAPAYLVATADAGTRSVALKWVGYALAAYLGLVVVGWLADRAVARFIRAHPEYDSWGDIWGADDEDPEVTEVAD